MNNERSKYWDIIKGLAIIAVVYRHSGASHIKIVYLYHLPLFFFISGFFYKEKYSNDPYLYTTNKIRAIIFPAIKYYLIFTILHNVLFKLNIYAPIEGDPMITQVFPYDWMNMIGAIFNSLFMTSWETIGGPIWFVKPLFVVMVTFCFIRYFFYVKLSKLVIKKELLIALTILGVSFIGMQFVKENITLPWRAEIGLLVLPIVYYGYILNERFDKDKLRGGLFILNIILIIFILNKNGGIDLSANRINNSIYFFLG